MKRLIEKIAQMQNPSVVGLDSLLDYIPQHIKDEKFEQYGDSFDAAAQAILETPSSLSTKPSSTLSATSFRLSSHRQPTMSCTAGRECGRCPKPFAMHRARA